MSTLRGLITLVLLVAFLGIVLWTLRGANRDRFEAAARIPLEEEADSEPPR